jgi:hypothetical protein
MTFKDWWKSKSYSLKGGLIGLVIIFIYSSIMYSIILTKGISINDSFYSSFPMMFLVGQYFPSSLIFCMIVYFLFGASAGFIIGIFKSKR